MIIVTITMIIMMIIVIIMMTKNDNKRYFLKVRYIFLERLFLFFMYFKVEQAPEFARLRGNIISL